MITSCIIKNCDSKKRLKSKKVITRTSVYIVYIQCIQLHFPLIPLHFRLCISEKASKSVIFYNPVIPESTTKRKNRFTFSGIGFTFQIPDTTKSTYLRGFWTSRNCQRFLHFWKWVLQFCKRVFHSFFPEKFFWKSLKKRLTNCRKSAILRPWGTKKPVLPSV